MTQSTDPLDARVVRVPRSRAALSGVLLILLGGWAALAPFIGPYFSFAFTPDTAWVWTSARGWLEVLPGSVAAVGGLLMLLSTDRITATVGAWLGIVGGGWLIVGRTFDGALNFGRVGTPTGSTVWIRTVEDLVFFDGVGALILLVAALAAGRLSVRSVRDVRAAQRRQEAIDAEQERALLAAQTQREAVFRPEGQPDAMPQYVPATDSQPGFPEAPPQEFPEPPQYPPSPPVPAPPPPPAQQS